MPSAPTYHCLQPRDTGSHHKTISAAASICHWTSQRWPLGPPAFEFACGMARLSCNTCGIAQMIFSNTGPHYGRSNSCTDPSASISSPSSAPAADASPSVAASVFFVPKLSIPCGVTSSPNRRRLSALQTGVHFDQRLVQLYTVWNAPFCSLV